jgi:hypothetical protein
MAQMDVPVFCDSPFETAPGRPLWYDDNLFLMYHASFDRYFNVPHPERLRRMQADFAALCAAHDGGYLIMYTHPCRLVTAQFTDNFTHGRNPPRSQWGPSPLRPPREIAELQQDFDAFLAWVVRQPNVELTTYRRLYAQYRLPAAPWLTAAETLRLAALAPERSYERVNGSTLSPAEQFGVLVRAAAALSETGSLPVSLPVRRLLGPTEIPSAGTPVAEAATSEILTAARAVDILCTETGAVPARVALGTTTIGPSAFAQAAARLLTRWAETRRLPSSVEIRPVPEYPAIAERDDFQRLKFQDGWSIFPPEFEGRNVLEMIRLQAWTAKPA